jgi:phosphoglycolate phosphatase
MEKKIGILFDLDGTLLDTLQDLTDAVNHTMEQFGYPLCSNRQVRSYLGNGARELIRLAMGVEDIPAVDTALAAYIPYYNAHNLDKTKPYDGIPEALRILSEKYPLAVVSNKPDVGTKALCAQFFPGVYALGEHAGCPRKPAPDMLLKAMADLGVNACVYVGDSEVDVITAQSAGMPCVSVLWGFRDRPEIEENGGKYFCEDPRELPKWIEKAMEELL